MPSASTQALDDQHLQWLVDAIAHKHLPIVREATAHAWSDGEVLHLPLNSDTAPLAAITISLWITAESLNDMPARLGKSARIDRYLALELQRALALYCNCLPPKLEQVLRHYVTAGTPPLNSSQSLLWAEDTQHPVKPLPAYLGTLKRKRISRLIQAVAGPKEPERKANSLGKREDTPDQRDSLLRMLTNPYGGSNWMSELMLQLLGFEHSAGGKAGDAGGSSALAATSDSNAPSGSFIQQLASKLHATGAAQAYNAQCHYPEWSEKVGRYRPDWVHVHEVTQDQHDEQAHDPSMPRAFLQQLAAEGMRLRRHRHQPSGDDPDIDTLLDRIVARRAGSDAQPTYTALQRDQRDLSVLILVDASGSTGDNHAGDTATGNNPQTALIDEHRWAAMQLAKGFSQLGDSTAIYGFHSHGRYALRMLRIKRFDEPLSLRCRHRLDALKPAGFTRMGGAIRHATALLKQQTHVEHRLLILISDGFPYDTEYNGSYAEGDTAKALREAADAHIATIGISLGGDSDDNDLKQVYGDATYIKLSSRRQLYQQIRPLLRSAFKGF